MNEQLIVKNFGPIKDATVDFKRVTVFIGPTGGGKSTLAKLAAILHNYHLLGKPEDNLAQVASFNLENFLREDFEATWSFGENEIIFNSEGINVNKALINKMQQSIVQTHKALSDKIPIPSLSTLVNLFDKKSPDTLDALSADTMAELIRRLTQNAFEEVMPINFTRYIPSERIFVSAIEYSWAGLMRDNIGLPKMLLEFANDFSLSRKQITELEIPFLNVKYLHVDGRDQIKIPDREAPLMLLETASGIQSVTPLLVLLEHLSRNTEQAQSFIIEEPELNLYPIAQQGLLNWLVEKCTKGENDLTLTTHSPYILSHLNLLLYAYHVGTKDEEKRQKVAAIIPEQYWINPDEFAAYYVNGPEGEGGVRSLLDPETKLISQNELDSVSGVQADEFDQLLDINRGF